MRPGQWLAAFYGVAGILMVGAVASGGSGEFALALFGAPATIWMVVRDFLPGPRQTPSDRAAGLQGDFHLHPGVVVLVVAGAIQFVERVAGMVVGAAVGTALAFIGVEPGPLFQEALLAALPVILLVNVVAIVPISVWAAHRLAGRRIAWIVLAIILSRLVTGLVGPLVLGGAIAIEALLLEVAVGVLLLPGAFLGTWWAERTRYSYVMARLFNELTPADQSDIVEMARVAGIRKVAPDAAVPADAGA